MHPVCDRLCSFTQIASVKATNNIATTSISNSQFLQGILRNLHNLKLSQIYSLSGTATIIHHLESVELCFLSQLVHKWASCWLIQWSAICCLELYDYLLPFVRACFSYLFTN